MIWSSRNFALLGYALILPPFAALAQTVPEPPPPLEDFWLEPGQPQQPTLPPAEQGPSTPETAPRPTPQETPPEPRSRPAAPQTAPAPAEQPAANAQPAASTPPEVQPETGVSQATEPPRRETPPAPIREAPAPQPEQPAQATSPDETDGTQPWLAWWWLALPLLMLAGLAGAWLHKRRRAARQPRTEAQDNALSPAAKGPPASPLGTGAAAPEPSQVNPVSPGGFVTTRLTPPKPAPPPPRPASRPATPRTTSDGPVEVELIVDKGATTLVNAVVEYRIKLRNRTDGPLTGILVDAVLQQAQTTAPDNIFLAARHDCDLLPAGAVAEVNGELKMPLNTIQPIAVRDRKIFVPMVSLSLVATDAQGRQHRQQHAFLIGQEHRPPEARMAPFRLDLGPRSFAPVGTRALEPA